MKLREKTNLTLQKIISLLKYLNLNKILLKLNKKLLTLTIVFRMLKKRKIR